MSVNRSLIINKFDKQENCKQFDDSPQQLRQYSQFKENYYPKQNSYLKKSAPQKQQQQDLNKSFDTYSKNANMNSNNKSNQFPHTSTHLACNQTLQEINKELVEKRLKDLKNSIARNKKQVKEIIKEKQKARDNSIYQQGKNSNDQNSNNQQVNYNNILGADSKVNEINDEVVQTFHTEFPLSSDRHYLSNRVNKTGASNYSKIFIPVILENKCCNIQNQIQLKPGDSIVDLYKLDSFIRATDAYSIFDGTCIIEESQGDRVIIKVYEPCNDGFNLGLKEIINYLHLYEFKINFHESGITRMRDFFYYRNKLIIVTELIGSPLANINKRFLSLSSIKIIIEKAIRIIQNLNSLRLLHMNVTPYTFSFYFFKTTINLCISDFENSIIYDKIQYNESQNNQDNQVDNHYSAPEIILGIERDEKADLWSLGCMLYELLTNEQLFKTNDKKEIIYMVKKIFEGFSVEKCKNLISNEYDDQNNNEDLSQKTTNNKIVKYLQYKLNFKLEIFKNQKELNEKISEVKNNLKLLKESPTLYDFLLRLLQVNPQHRININGALHHKWLTQN